jgi:hypothetical protein
MTTNRWTMASGHPGRERRPGRLGLRSGALTGALGALGAVIWTALATAPAHAAVLAASETGDGDGRLGVLALLLAGPLLYTWIHLRYRNKHVRHHYESETDVKVDAVQATDNFLEHRTRKSESSLPGANASAMRGNAVDSALGVFEKMVSKQVGDGSGGGGGGGR